jgi:hypothetical protein
VSTTFDRLVEEYEADVRCKLCRQPVTVRGCKCRLQGLYADRAQEVLAWYASLPVDLQNPRKGFRALPAVMSALTAERSKAGLTDEPSNPDDPQGISAATDERVGQYRELGIDPQKTKWRKNHIGPERRPARRSSGVNPATAGGVGGRATTLSTTVR